MGSSNRRRSASLFLVPLALLGACAVSPTHVLDLMDAESDAEIEDSTAAAAGYLLDRAQRKSVRLAAARVLGRLRHGTPEVIDALGRVLGDPNEDAELRAHAAWSLGEMRSDPALSMLLRTMRTPIDGLTGEYVLEGLAKHEALLSRSDDRLLETVEAMVDFGARQRGRASSIYDVLSEATRTVPVNIKVLERSIDHARDGTLQDRSTGATYNAVYELLESLERSRGEIRAGGKAWPVQIEISAVQIGRALELDDPHTTLLALWYLGRLSDIRELASSAALVLVGADAELPSRPSVATSCARRLVATWMLSRMQLHSLGPRRALLRDVLSRETEGVVLRLLADVSRPSDDEDALQRILGVERAP